MATNPNSVSPSGGPATHQYEHVKMSYRSKKMADTYDSKRFQSRWGKTLNRKLLVALIGIMRSVENKGYRLDAILDMPCGTGRAYPAFLSYGYNFTGSDISLEMMIESRKKLYSPDDAPLVQTDMEQTAFKDNSFDAIICLRFLTMNTSSEARLVIFKEMRRISRKWVILECQHMTPATQAVNYIAQDVFGKKPVYRYFTKDKIQRELKQAGISIERIFHPYGMLSNKWLILGKVIK